MNPYEVLEVPEDADQETIQKAYKKKAMKLHPDRNGGDDTAFKELGIAYELLSNPEEKAYYDEHGEARDREEEIVIANSVAVILVTLIETMPDVDSADLMELVRNQISQSINSTYSEISRLTTVKNKYEKAMKRLKGKEDQVRLILTTHLSMTEKKLAEQIKRKDDLTKMFKLAETFTYDVDSYPFNRGGGFIKGISRF